jgi:hypothetical protein
VELEGLFLIGASMTQLIEGPFQNNPAELLLLTQSLNTYNFEKKSTGRLQQLTQAIASAL